MATLNKAILIGYVGKEPDVRYLETPEHPKVARSGGCHGKVHTQGNAALRGGQAAYQKLGIERQDGLPHGDSCGQHPDAGQQVRWRETGGSGCRTMGIAEARIPAGSSTGSGR